MEMKVKVIYRNYIPLYSGYCSFWLTKLPNIDVIVPPPNQRLKKLLKTYRKLRKVPFFSKAVGVFQKLFFAKAKEEDIDLYFYACMLPTQSMNKPFVVDFENAHSLFDFGDVTERRKIKVLEILSSKYCKKILPWSEAAATSLEKLYEKEYPLIKDKIEVLYPALPLYKNNSRYSPDFSHVKRNSNLKLLFVGGSIYRKGLIEALEAFKIISKKEDNIEFYCVANIPEKEKEKYKDKKIHFYPTNFSHDDVLKKFFMTCDFFIMPTHEDTFGMVLLEALSSGMPVITTKQFATPEIVREGENGFFVDSDVLFLEKYVIPPRDHDASAYRGIEKKLVKSIVKKLDYILENKDILKKMSTSCLKDFQDGGKFSLSRRNKALARIFCRATNYEE